MSRPSRCLLAAVAAASLFASAVVSAQRFNDPPGRVARISDMRGEIAYSPGGDGDWYPAHRNRPLVRGDALWADQGSRAELQAGSTWIRMDQETSVEFLELSDRLLQIEITEGTVNVRVRRLHPGQRVEVDTPNLAFVIDRPGNFRIDVDRDDDNTTVEARQGGGMVYGVGGRFPVRNRDVVVFYGEDIRDYQMYAFPASDNFDRYTRMRDQRIERSVSLRYLGDDLVGFADLDDYGRWSRYPTYGAVWFPSNVYSGWAPYQDGQWIWQEPWGWTWVDDEPWGFAPSHYGRWAWIEGRWGWVPGSRSSRSVYAPALVAFVEDLAGSIGWFPLGPGDIYYPTYSVSATYFTQVNVSNSAMTGANIGRAYSSYGRANSVPMAQGAYRNRSVPTAVTTVPKEVFINSRPVREAAVRGAGRESRVPAELRRNLAVRPGAASLRGAAQAGRVRPPREVEDEQVFVRTAPPAVQAPSSATATPAPAPAVRERPRRVRMISEQASSADARAIGPRSEPAAPAAPAAAGAPAAAATPAAPGGKLQQLDRDALPRARGGRRFQDRPQREQPVTPAAAPAAAPAAPAAAPVAAPAAQAAAQDEARQAQEARTAEQKAREEQRQAMEAKRKSEQEQRQAAQAERDAQQQRAQAQAESGAQQQREAAAAEAKAQQEQQQAQAAELEAKRQQRESERALRQAAREQEQAKAAAAKSDAAQAAATTEAPAVTPAATPAATPPRGQARECVPAARIEAMRKRGVSEERIAEMKVCPEAEAPPQQQ